MEKPNQSHSTKIIKHNRNIVFMMVTFPIVVIFLSGLVFYNKNFQNNNIKAAAPLWQTDFNTGNWNFGARTWAGADHAEIVNEGYGGGKSVKVSHFPGQYYGAASYPNFSSNLGISSLEDVYLRYYLKPDPNYHFRLEAKIPGLAGNIGDGYFPSGCDPTDSNRGWSGRLQWGLGPQYNHKKGRIQTYLYVGHPASNTGCGYKAEWSEGAELEQGQWACIEIRYKMNTPGQRNGTMQGWFNGEKKYERSDILFRNNSSIKANTLANVFYHGGTSAWQPIQNQHLLFDKVAISDQRIGCEGSSTPVSPPTTPAPSPPSAPTPVQTPFKDIARTFPGTIQAEDYDVGGEGKAYYDTTPGNHGAKYRSDDVDLYLSGEGGYNIGFVGNNEWTEYTINTVGGKYSLSARVASIYSDAKMRVKLDGQVLGVFDIPNTGGWQNWQTINLNNITIPSGSNKILRLELLDNEFNINWLSANLTPENSPSPPDPTPTPTPINNPEVPEVVVTRPSDPPPLINIPGAGESKIIEIPASLQKNNDGQLIGDFNGDGFNDIAFDLNNDGAINPTEEIVVDGKNEINLTDTTKEPILAEHDAELINVVNTQSNDQLASESGGVITIKAGPLPEAKISKPVAYTFLAAQGVALTGLGTYFAITKLAIFSGLRGRLGL